MNDDTKAIYAALAARFPIEAHKTKTIGGRELIYVDGEMVISRLNDALGFDGWSFEVEDVTVLDDEVWARGRLTVLLRTQTVVREQAGGQIINRKSGTPVTPERPAQPADGDRPAIPAVPARPAVKGDVIEISNDVKGAITDCLKKCASLIGVGLYLFDPVARREIEAEMRGGAKPAASSPTPRPRSSDAPAGRATANTQGVSGAAPSSSSTTDTDADQNVHDSAILTGAAPQPIDAIRCHACGLDVAKTGTVTILKKKDGPKVEVKVSDFEPVCKERLGEFHCAACYDKKHWGAA